ncbi:M48 family metalloprotease [Streptomyces tricolor]|uniref:M48 family metalloprotease n=1 Tax=Streptomyces tricolor TaxID=68277 RepID=A0ABS9JBB9_9ACTN|nr:M48 family metalloprotease [Streptomyces tricolor]MCG0062863.1 M48 family metalloprotease [Streptomyces tricolor]
MPAHDDPLFRTGRVHIAARQRGVDITAVVGLALHVPHVLAGLTLVFTASYAVDILGGPPWWVTLGGWAVSGALVFHRPCERLMARLLFGLRHPTPKEAVPLRAVWREVTARAGVDGDAYQLWVEDSHGINAMATAGHIVGVTSHALRTLPPAQLAGVLAHELGHHTRGHSWASLLTFWYALPGRLAWRLLLRLATRVERLSAGAAIVVVGLFGAAVIVLATSTYGLVFLPLATPYLAAAVSRRSELRADEHAAVLGFGAQLMDVLSQEHERKSRPYAAPRGRGIPATKESITARLLDDHPDVHTRLHHLHCLQKRLENRR